jgi:hypothetical protein
MMLMPNGTDDVGTLVSDAALYADMHASMLARARCRCHESVC